MHMHPHTHVHTYDHACMYTATHENGAILLHTEKADTKCLSLKRMTVFNICKGKLLTLGGSVQ